MKRDKKIEIISITAIVLLLFILYQSNAARESLSSEDIDTCNTEDSLAFEGLVTDYSGTGAKSKPIILLLDGRQLSIPRYNYQFSLWTGDSIKKIKGTHYYIIKHNNRLGKIYDTVSFKCP